MSLTWNDLLFGLVFLLLGFLIGYLIFKLRLNTQKKDFENAISLLKSGERTALDRLEAAKRQFAEQAERKEKEFSERMREIRKEREDLRTEKENFRVVLERRNAEYRNLEEKLKTRNGELEKWEEKFETAFENLANSILEKKSEKFTHLNKENIENLLKPLRAKISSFESKVENSEKESVKRHAQMKEQLRNLNQQNLKISEEALNLTKALKGNTKTQGSWGEMILERVLERSGLQKGSEYTVQDSFRMDNGRYLRPDVVIHLPGNRKMIVDSKVSLTAYERYVNTTDYKEKERNLKKHLVSLQKHVEELSRKDYQRLYEMESPNFVLLFIPVEAAFAVASNANPQLYGEAFDQNIILVTPTTLLAVLGTVDSMWQNEHQTQNAVEIATRAGKLYDSFVSLITQFEKVGRQLNSTQKTYDTAMRKLTGRGNLIRKVEKLKELGAKTGKQMDKRYLE